MSAKATGLVWDLECPATINGLPFRPNHKYVLVAYADHADHNGRSMFPAISTVSKKTGLDDRTVQRMTRDLEEIGLLVEDGKGPRGTNRWNLPYNDRGDRLTPVRLPGVTPDPIPSGDNPSGDNPSGDTQTPESGEPLTIHSNNELLGIFLKASEAIFQDVKDLSNLRTVKAELEKTSIDFNGSAFIVSGLPEDRTEYYQDRYKRLFERALIGFLGQEVPVEFTGGDAITV
jgi:hypothetical protein